ncbi:MAG: hypothetical protein M3Y70_05075 [Pseudomonadota bacterium]|nr:hypothetical protein [Pseudomonadota bacterium]
MDTGTKRIATLAMSVLMALAACGKSEQGASVDAGEVAAGPRAEEGDAPAISPAGSGRELLIAPDWMPEDWDRNVYRGANPANTPEQEHHLRQQHQLATPLLVWSLAHYGAIDERFQPAWVWWTALRSCERGIRLSDDLAGEFGDRARGEAALVSARKELKAFAATQPDDITLYFSAELGRWDERAGTFPLIVPNPGWSIDARQVERLDDEPFLQGASAVIADSLENDGFRHLLELHAVQSDMSCVSADRSTTHTFSLQSTWYVVFGTLRNGSVDGYSSNTRLPGVDATREQAAAIARRNPERKVMVAVTFGAEEAPAPTFRETILSVHGVLRKVVVTDAVDGSTLATKTY